MWKCGFQRVYFVSISCAPTESVRAVGAVGAVGAGLPRRGCGVGTSCPDISLPLDCPCPCRVRGVCLFLPGARSCDTDNTEDLPELVRVEDYACLVQERTNLRIGVCVSGGGAYHTTHGVSALHLKRGWCTFPALGQRRLLQEEATKRKWPTPNQPRH